MTNAKFLGQQRERLVEQRAHATTTSGDIDVVARLQGPGPFRVATVSGDGVLATSGDLRVETTTLSGDLHSEVPARAEGRRGRRSLIIGTGEPVLTFQSMSGDLSIVGPRVVGPRAVRATASMERPAPTKPEPVPNGAIAAAYEEARLRILRSLERGEIDIEEAGRRFEALDGGEPVDPASATTRTAVVDRPMPDEALERVLRLVAEGRLTAAEAAPILEALGRARGTRRRAGPATAGARDAKSAAETSPAGSSACT